MFPGYYCKTEQNISSNDSVENLFLFVCQWKNGVHRSLGIFLLIRDTNTGAVEELKGVVVERSDATVLLGLRAGQSQVWEACTESGLWV